MLSECCHQCQRLLIAMQEVKQCSMRYDTKTRQMYYAHVSNRKHCISIAFKPTDFQLNFAQNEFVDWFEATDINEGGSIIIKVQSGYPLSKKYYVEKELNIISA